MVVVDVSFYTVLVRGMGDTLSGETTLSNFFFKNGLVGWANQVFQAPLIEQYVCQGWRTLLSCQYIVVTFKRN